MIFSIRKFAFGPPCGSQRATQPLSALGFSTARSDDLVNRNRYRGQDPLQLRDRLWKITQENGLSVRDDFDLEASVDQSCENRHFRRAS